MRRLTQTPGSGCWCLLAAILLVLAAGCASQRVDWTARVGHYTFDQSVLEIGPPDKQAKLADGSLVAEWLTHRGRTQSYPAIVYSPGYYGPIYPVYSGAISSPDYFLRLTFGPDGQLQAWKKFAK